MLSSVKSFIQENPATTTITAANIAAHLYLHNKYIPSWLNLKNKKKYLFTNLDDVSTTGSSIYEEKDYKRIPLTLFSHADDSHLLYNLVHLMMYFPVLENSLVDNSSSSSSLKKIASMSSLYLLTGSCGIFLFLKGIQKKYSKFEESDYGLYLTSQFIPLVGNSPSAYGLHALASTYLLLTSASSSSSSSPSSYNLSKILPILFAIESSLPPYLSLLERQKMIYNTEYQRQLQRQQKESSSSSCSSLLQSNKVPVSQVIKATLFSSIFGGLHYFGVKEIIDYATSSAQSLKRNENLVPFSFFLYMLFRRFSLPFFSKMSKRFLLNPSKLFPTTSATTRISDKIEEEEENNTTSSTNHFANEEETAMDDHFGHLGGVLSGVVVGLILRKFLNTTKDSRNDTASCGTPNDFYFLVAPSLLTLGELCYCAWKQYSS